MHVLHPMTSPYVSPNHLSQILCEYLNSDYIMFSAIKQQKVVNIFKKHTHQESCNGFFLGEKRDLILLLLQL